MVHDGIELQFSVVAYILAVAVRELERNKVQLSRALLKDDLFQVKVCFNVIHFRNYDNVQCIYVCIYI